jgi:uncharacterized damage-inducible protein DinB
MDDDAYFVIIRQLSQYEVWCQGKALDAAEKLERVQLFQEFPFGMRTIHRTLFHMLGVFGYWSGFILPEVEDRWQWDYKPEATIEQMKQMSGELAAKFLGAIDASHAAGILGRDRRLVQVFHLVTHGTHHRTQFISMLRMLGKDPPFEAGDFAGWQRVNFEMRSGA